MKQRMIRQDGLKHLPPRIMDSFVERVSEMGKCSMSSA